MVCFRKRRSRFIMTASKHSAICTKKQASKCRTKQDSAEEQPSTEVPLTQASCKHCCPTKERRRSKKRGGKGSCTGNKRPACRQKDGKFKRCSGGDKPGCIKKRGKSRKRSRGRKSRSRGKCS